MHTIREKRTKSGPLLEIDYYPVFSPSGKAVPKKKPPPEKKELYNARESVKRLVRLVNANFDTQDYLMGITYAAEAAPQSEEEARKDIGNYFRRIRTKRASELKKVEKQLRTLPPDGSLKDLRRELMAKRRRLRRPMKTAYSLERITYQRGPYRGRANWHSHLFITGGLDQRTMERIWKKGIQVSCDYFQPDRFGPEAAARYMSKCPKGKKKFSCSKNMKKPDVSQKDGRISAATVEKMATKLMDDARYWQNKAPGYKLLRTYPRYDEYNGYWYMTVVMYKTDAEEIIPFEGDTFKPKGYDDYENTYLHRSGP